MVKQYVKKGALMLVSGRLAVRKYTDTQNAKKTIVEILANDVIFLTPKAKEDEKPSELAA